MVSRIDRSHVGKHWKRYQFRSMQVILQATHGIVSGASDFFREAFGETADDFKNLLFRPHHMIFNRFWYKPDGGGEAEFHDYQAVVSTLSGIQKAKALDLLSEVMFDLPDQPRLTRDGLRNRFAQQSDADLRAVLAFYVPPTKEEECKIWDLRKAIRTTTNFGLAEDEVVEDAGLQDGGDDAQSLPIPERHVA
ncbi:MAG: Radical SAM domain protein [Rhodospirillaceae bacterium]|nr:MAG: Radical SAM domain protein [Rhodospirillaceae bacterium]